MKNVGHHAFVSLSSLAWGKSYTLCTRTRSCARSNDAKMCNVQCDTEELRYVTLCFLLGHVGRAERHRWSLCHQSVKEGCHRSRWWCWMHHDREESSGITRQTAFPDISFLLFPVLCEPSILLLNIIIKFIPFFFLLICREPPCDLQQNNCLERMVFSYVTETTTFYEKWYIASLNCRRVIYKYETKNLRDRMRKLLLNLVIAK